jgi:hypothetical protein
MHKRLISICLLLLILLLNINAFADEIYIDASHTIGHLPEIFSSSIWLTYIDEGDEYKIKKFLRENRPSTIQFTISRILRESKDFGDFKEDLRRYFLSPPASLLIDTVRKRGIRLIIGYDPRGMPKWLSSRPAMRSSISRAQKISVMNVSPPRDYGLWGRVVEYTVNLLFNELKIHNLGFYVGHEPNDRDWAGTERSFFRYYETAAKAVKGVDKRILVGGIGVWSVRARKAQCDRYPKRIRRICQKEGWADGGESPMLYNFLQYVGRKDIPLDFINWHSFRPVPVDIGQRQVSTLREWIRASGLKEGKISLYPSDWTYWSMHAGGYPADYLDTEEDAAYIVNTLYNMWVAGIDWAGHDFNVRNPLKERRVSKERKGASFIGDWSLFTRDGIVKPSYNAFRVVSMLSGPRRESIRVLDTRPSSDKRITAVSVIDGGTKEVRTIIANFSPSDIKILHPYLKEMLRVEGYMDVYNALTEVERCIGRKKGRQRIRLFEECVEGIHADKRLMLKPVIDGYKCLLSKDPGRCIIEHRAGYKGKGLSARIYRYISDNVLERRVTLRYIKLPYDGRVSIDIYRIDSDNANACRLNKSTEPSPTDTPCGIGGLIDRKVRRARIKAREDALRGYLLRMGYGLKEVERIISDLRDCPSWQRKDCLKEIRKRHRVKINLRELMREYHRKYFSQVDDINSINGVSLEGSVRRIYGDVKDGRLVIDLKVKPNTVLLIVIRGFGT